MRSVVTILWAVFASLFIIACESESKLQEYKVQGMRVSQPPVKERVLALRYEKSSLKIVTDDGSSTNVTIISPWPQDKRYFISTNLLYLEARVDLHPQGSIKILRFYQDKYLRLQLVDNAKMSYIVVPGWAIQPGIKIGQTNAAGTSWCGVRLTGPQGQFYDVLPGETRRLGSPAFTLLSARRQEDIKPMVADDSVSLTADYMLEWSGD